MSSVLVGMFDSQAAATQARSELVSAGFAANSVLLTGGTGSTSTDASGGTSTSATTGAFEPPRHDGAIARFFHDLFGMNDDRDDRERTAYTETYHEAFRRGSYGVTVTALDDTELDRAEAILNRCGAVDIDEQAESWRQEGWTGGSLGSSAGLGAAGSALPSGLGAGTGSSVAGASTTGTSTSDTAGMGTSDMSIGGTGSTGASGIGSTFEAGSTQKLQEVEEELKVGKRAVARGGVRIFSRTTEVPVSETVRLREEHADVRRTAVDRPATEADLNAFKEGSIEVREMGEEAVVSKSARVVGEVEISKTETERDETVSDTVRQTRVEVEHIPGDAGSSESASGSLSGRSGSEGVAGSSDLDPVETGGGSTTTSGTTRSAATRPGGRVDIDPLDPIDPSTANKGY